MIKSELQENVREFAEGRTPVTEFHTWLVHVLIGEAPVISSDVNGDLEASFSYAADCAMYLEMETDPDDPNFDVEGARKLAASLAAIGEQLGHGETAQALAHFARGRESTIERLGQFLAGTISRAALETFVGRRPWPEPHKAAVRRLSHDQIGAFLRGLSDNDYRTVSEALFDEPESWR